MKESREGKAIRVIVSEDTFDRWNDPPYSMGDRLVKMSPLGATSTSAGGSCDMAWTTWVLLLSWHLTGDAVRLDGTQATGDVKSLSTTSLDLETSAGPVSIPLAELQTLRIPGESITTDPLAVTFVEGSVVQSTNVAVTTGKLTFSGGPLDGKSVSVEQLHAIRLGPAEATLLPAWQEMQEKVSQSDLLIIRKGDALDFVTGTIGTIDVMSVSLLARGREVKVARDKVFGVVYATHPRVPGAPQCELELANGSRLRAKSVIFESGNATFTTAFAASLSVPVDSLRSLDFALGRITPLMKALTRESYARDSAYLKVRNFQILTSTGMKAPLKLGGQAYPDGLVVHPETKLEFTLNRQYKRLRTLVGIDETISDRANFEPIVRLQLFADGKSVFDQELRWDQAPMAVDLDLNDVRRLELVTSSRDGKTGPCRLLDLADAKLIK